MSANLFGKLTCTSVLICLLNYVRHREYLQNHKKTPFSHLRKLHNKNFDYLDDSWLRRDSFLQCLGKCDRYRYSSHAVGFTVNFKKLSSQHIEYLGCFLDWHLMRVFLTPHKPHMIQEHFKAFLGLDCCFLRKLVQLL